MATLRFTKMEGAGNDYVYVDAVHAPFDFDRGPEIARFVSDRRLGVAVEDCQHRRAELRLDADHLGLARARPGGDRASRDQPAAADRNHDHVEIGTSETSRISSTYSKRLMRRPLGK